MMTSQEYDERARAPRVGLERTVLLACTERLSRSARASTLMGRKILFITTDQQRYDSLGCNGGTIARTPVVDGLAASGVNYQRAYNQNTVCMPARSTMLTGQYVRTHGVVANGVPLPDDAPSVAAYLHDDAGYRTALLGKAHFEPGFDLRAPVARELHGGARPHRSVPRLRARRARDARAARRQARAAALRHAGSSTRTASTRRRASRRCSRPSPAATPARPRRGSTRSRASGTTPTGSPTARSRTSTRCPTTPTGSCGCRSPIRTTRGIRPRRSSTACNWRDLDLPPGHPGSNEKIERVLAQKPAHWLELWEGTFVNAEGGPGTYRPQNVSHDNIREINAMAHIMNEMIDEACGRVLRRVASAGWDDDTDVFFTTDHGELQGDYGLIFKGPFHTDSLMRLPMVWRPAPSAGVAPADVQRAGRSARSRADVLRDRRRRRAGVDAGRARSRPRPGSGRERVLCEWDSQFPGYGMHLRSIYRDGWLCTAYEKSTVGEPNGLEKFFAATGHVRRRDRPGRARSSTTAPKASSTTSTRIRTSGRTAGTIPRARRSAKTSSPISTTRCRRNARSSKSSGRPAGSRAELV